MNRQQLAALREERGAVYNEMRAALDAAGENGLSAEDQSTYDAAEARFDTLDAQITAEERFQERSRETTAPSYGGSDGDAERAAAHRSETRAERFESALTTLDQSRNRDVAVREFMGSEEYREAWLEGVVRNVSDVAEYRAALAVGTNPEGGYTAPLEFQRQLLIDLAQEHAIRGLANVFSTEHGRELDFPLLATKGVAGWASEVPTPGTNESEPTFAAPRLLKAYVATREVVTSKDLLQDSVFDIEGLVRSLIAESFGDLENPAFISGNGVGKPTGITVDLLGANVTTGAVGQTTSVKGDDLIDVQHGIKPKYRKGNQRWVLKDSTFKAVRKLKDNNLQYLWQPGLSAGSQGTILGDQYVVDEDMPAMGVSVTSILYGDFSGYYIRDVLDLSIQRLNELYARSRQIGFFADKRVDGKLIKPDTVSAYKNSAT